MVITLPSQNAPKAIWMTRKMANDEVAHVSSLLNAALSTGTKSMRSARPCDE